MAEKKVEMKVEKSDFRSVRPNLAPIVRPFRPAYPPMLEERFAGVMAGRALANNTFDALGAEVLLRGQFDAEDDNDGNVDPSNDPRTDGRYFRLNSVEENADAE